MNAPVVVRIVGVPASCGEGGKDPWREVAAWTSGQLVAYFGEAVRVEYFDLFDPTCPILPSGTELPAVLVDGEVFSSGGKISVPAIRKQLEALGVAPARVEST